MTSLRILVVFWLQRSEKVVFLVHFMLMVAFSEELVFGKSFTEIPVITIVP